MTAKLADVKRERDLLLARLHAAFEADARVNAAWLSGSFGRGEADEWSDLDLHVAVADESLDLFLTERETLFSKCGQHILVFGDVPSNSMPRGYFWLVQYAPFMLEIDWNIGPTEGATRPTASQLLFDRVGISTAPPLLVVNDERRLEIAKLQLLVFWSMTPIAIKFAGRGHTRLAVEQIKHLQSAFIQLWRVVRNPILLQSDAYHQNRRLESELDACLPRLGPTIDPLAVLKVIRSFCAEVEALHPALAELGASVNEDVVKEAAALVEAAEECAASGGSKPYQGSRR